MQVSYNDKSDLLYIRFDDRTQDVINRRVSDDVVLDIGEGNKIIGIENAYSERIPRRFLRS